MATPTTSSSSITVAVEEEPQSVEEAGALLGTAILTYGASGSFATIPPPKGIHSSFSVSAPVPSSELFIRLHQLRSLLRSAPRDAPLVAAPSLLAGVLMKLLGVSSQVASVSGTHSGLGLASPSISGMVTATSDKVLTTIPPPLLSTPLRKLWVDCVVLCHVLGEGLSGNSRINLFGFVRQMIQLALLNPRTARAAGGTRIAALQVIAALLQQEKLAKPLSGWALDILQVCPRALKSSGTGEPSYRVAAMDMARAIAVASREAWLETRPNAPPLALKGALEDKAIVEMVRLLKIAVSDKYPEVRLGAAQLTAVLAPLVLHTSIKSPQTPEATATSPTVSLEDLLTLSLKQLDDESPAVAAGWAEALARGMSTAIEYHAILTAEKTSNRNVEGDDEGPSGTPGRSSSRGHKGGVSTKVCATLPKAMHYIVGLFVKLGGELAAPKGGGTYSSGGRAVRNGLARTVVHLLRIQSSLEAIGAGKSISYKDAIAAILKMVGKDMQAQLEATNSASPANNLFGQSPKVSPSDACLARHHASRVLREGISVLSTESIQLSVLHELVHLCDPKEQLMGSQLQIVLVEISHLLATLGEATAAALDDLAPALERCLRDTDQGVRHEAAVACAAMASVFPARGRRLIQESVEAIQLEHAELMTLSSTQTAESVSSPKSDVASAIGRFARFRRQATPTKEVKVDESSKHKHAIHGLAFVTSLILRDLPGLPGGLPLELLNKAFSVAEILINTMFRDVMTTGNPGGVCTCVRGGFGILCGALATGTVGIVDHIPLVFGLWQKLIKDCQRGGGKFTAAHELVCVEAMLQSAVAFLRYCSELLLSVPDALSRISLLLEEILPLLVSDGRLGKAHIIPAAAAHLDSAKAAILEAFAWLPPGSYPMVADSVFAFAAGHIQSAIDEDVSCSILRSLVSREDEILDATTFSRATESGEVGDAKDLENDIISLRAEPASHNDREAAIHLLKSTATIRQSSDADFLNSQVLGLIVLEETHERPPTALHEVGTWRRPAMSSCSSKVRLVDASIQAFAATFTLKSSKEQQGALQMLESLLPPAHLQTPRASLTEQSRRGKPKDDSASAANVAAVLLSCLKALPIFESTHNIPINLGPVWMNKAKDVFLAILPSQSHEIRRAAAEGLGFLSTLGVREDARFLQSSVLHDLDEVIQGSQNQEQGKPMSLKAMTAGQSAALLTLACMQRTACRIKKEREVRSRERGGAEHSEQEAEDVLPLFQILIKILPSIAIRPTGGFLGVRTYGLHAFGLLFSYSNKLQAEQLSQEEMHLLRKVVELVEDNFLASWTAAATDYDHGTSADKLSSEASFVAVLLRIMTFVLPSLYRLKEVDAGVTTRFSRMATVMTDCFGTHPVVKMEIMAFYEVLAGNQHLLPAHAGGVKYDEHALLGCIPMLMESVQPNRATIHANFGSSAPIVGLSSPKLLRAALRVIRVLSLSDILVAEWSDMKMVSLLYTALEDCAGSQTFVGNTLHRNIAAPRESELVYKARDPTPKELQEVMRLLLSLERRQSQKCVPVLLRYILLSRCVLVGATGASDGDEDDETFSVAKVVQSALDRAISDTETILDYANPVRWQVKALAAQTTTTALSEISSICRQEGLTLADSPIFNPKGATLECRTACREATTNGGSLPESVLALHLGAVVTAACVTATATVDQAELRCLQECAMYLLVQVIDCFGSIPDPDQSNQTVLHDYIPQISSSVKNALGAPEEEDGAAPCRLFLVGCEALQVFLKTKVTSDRGVLKRVVRPVMPTQEEIPFFALDEGVPEKLLCIHDDKRNVDSRANLLIRIGKLWTIGNIPAEDGDLMAMLDADAAALGIHSAALATDGARLLLGSRLSLCGFPIGKDPVNKFAFKSGYFIRTMTDIDDSVKSSLTKSWAAIGNTSVTYLAKAIASDNKKDDCEHALKKLVPFLFAGFEDSLQAPKEGSLVPSKYEWARSINTSEVASSCLKGITTLASIESLLELDNAWTEKVESVLTQISASIFEPVVSGNTEQRYSIDLVRTSCALLLNLTRSGTLSMSEDSSVLLSILRPISLLESGAVDLSSMQACLVISACLTAVASIIPKTLTPASLVKAMIAVVLTASSKEKTLPTRVQTAIRILLTACLSHKAVTSQDQSEIAVAMAKSHDWETWSTVVSANEGVAAKASLAVVQGILLDSSDGTQQLAVLATLRNLLQMTPPPNALTGRLACALGTEVLAMFQAYGTLATLSNAKPHRMTVCADGMKIALVTLQQFATDGTAEEDVAQFLVVLFSTLIAVLRFNGLPNHPVPHPGSSDPVVGRMCAQAITHMARVAPTGFKSSMGLMAPDDRTVLEFAVRAEMSGYATAASQAPTKKKLNLKSFKK